MSDREGGEWILERYFLGELSREKMIEVEKIIQEDSTIQAQLSKLIKSNKKILANHPKQIIAAEIIDRYQKNNAVEVPNSVRRARPLKRLLVASPLLAIVAILLLVLLPDEKGQVLSVQDSHKKVADRSKGAADSNQNQPYLTLQRKTREKKVETLKNGTEAKAGDLLQISYMAMEWTHGIIFSIDGNGVVTLHFPSTREGATRLAGSQKTWLSNAYELDDAPGFERFFFISSFEDIDVTSLLDKAMILAKDAPKAKEATLELDRKFSQFSLLIIKVD